MIFTQMLKKNFITISGNETEANWHCQWQAAYLSSLCFDYKTESLYCQNRQKLLFLFLRIFVRSLMQVPCRKSMTETLYIYMYLYLSPFLLYLQMLSWNTCTHQDWNIHKLSIIGLIALCLNGLHCVILKQQTRVLIVEEHLILSSSSWHKHN